MSRLRVTTKQGKACAHHHFANGYCDAGENAGYRQFAAPPRFVAGAEHAAPTTCGATNHSQLQLELRAG
jgi:hypothetical protein